MLAIVTSYYDRISHRFAGASLSNSTAEEKVGPFTAIYFIVHVCITCAQAQQISDVNVFTCLITHMAAESPVSQEN